MTVQPLSKQSETNPNRINHRMKTKPLALLAFLWTTVAFSQPTILSTVPANMATGVSPTATVMFIFSQPMNPGATTVQFMDSSVIPPAVLPASSAWTGGNTILTCTPSPSWPANKMIVWMVDGENPAGDALAGTSGGMFATGSGGTGGTCTNEIGSLTVAKGVLYSQTSAGAPTLEPTFPYAFVACASVACSNWTTTNITLSISGGATTNLPITPIPGHYSLTVPAASSTGLEAAFPNGNYIFTLKSSAGNVPSTVNFPASLAWPNAPHLTNYVAAQAINPTQPFTLGWDAFQGAGAGDCIYLEIYGGGFLTPALGEPGALPGTTRSVTIPANTLQPNQTYSGGLTFYDLILSTNANGYLNLVYRAATTEFDLHTASGAPTLSIARTTTNTFVVSWPSPADGWVLERTNALPRITTAWPQIAPPYQSGGSTLWMTFTNAPGSQFFRLHKP
jgi:hypothetical protein